MPCHAWQQVALWSGSKRVFKKKRELGWCVT
jgi:hypothetical protein